MNDFIFIFLIIAVVGINIIGLIVLCFWAGKKTELRFYKDFVKITGMFGMVIPFTKIASVVMTNDKLPSMFRSWGLCFFGINKGDFDIYDNNEMYEIGEGCKLYTQTNKPPFIVIRTIYSQLIFINFRDKKLMEEYYSELLKYGKTED